MIKKILLLIAIGCGIPFVVLVLSMIFYSFFPGAWQDIDEAEKNFQKHKVLFILVKDFLVASEYRNVHILRSQERGTMSVNIPGNNAVHIDNEDVAEAVYLLLHRHGYSSISKKGNYIDFVRVQTYNTIYYGIVYSSDGSVPDDSAVQFLTSIEPLTEKGWYYYEARYNEYRQLRRNEQYN